MAAKATAEIPIPQGFQSLADKLSRAKNKMKSGKKLSDSIEEKFIEEFNEELESTLIPEESLLYVVDTARRVEVDGDIYQITEAGTFIYSEDEIEEFDQVYSNFLDTYQNYTNQLEDKSYMYGDVKFIDSYGFLEREDLSTEAIISMVNGDESIENTNSNSSIDNSKIVSEYTNTYHLTNYHVGGSTGFGQTMANIGLNNWRNKNFDSDHRVRVNLYELNYGFFKCAGFKVKFQLRHQNKITVGFGKWRKTIVLLSYWLRTEASKMVIGIDHFKGYTQFTNFGLTPLTYQEGVRKYSKNFANVAAKIVFKGFHKTPESLIEDWVSDIYLFGGTVEFPWDSYTDNDLNKALYDQGYKWIVGEFKKRTAGFVYEQTMGNSKIPVMMLSPGVGGNSNKEYLLLNGVSTYHNISKKKMRFGRSSGGVTFQGNLTSLPTPSGFTPNAFNIQEAYVFGAVKYNGEWKGIRMYIP